MNTIFHITFSWIFEVIFQNIIPGKSVSLVFRESEGRDNIHFFGGRPLNTAHPVNHSRARAGPLYWKDQIQIQQYTIPSKL